jgi:hypothetical protein
MRKEVFIAIILGATIGGIVTYGVYRANQALINKATGNNPQLLDLPSPPPITEANIDLNIISPQNSTVTDQDIISIEGKSIENAIIAISTDTQDFIIETDKNGLFNQEVELVKGANTIKVTASDGAKLSPQQSLNIVYSTNLDMEDN